jgi:hypothetical protein
MYAICGGNNMIIGVSHANSVSVMWFLLFIVFQLFFRQTHMIQEALLIMKDKHFAMLKNYFFVWLKKRLNVYANINIKKKQIGLV